MTTEQTVKADATTSLTWLQKHERILIVTLVLLAASWLGNNWLNISAERDKRSADLAAQQLSTQKDKDTQLAAQVSQLNTQYQSVVAQLSEQNAQIAAAMSNRTVVLQQQQATDKTMPLPDLTTRWASIAGLSISEFSPATNGVTVSDTGARATVAQLEQVPTLTANLKDETTVADNRQQELTKANDVIGGLNQQVTSLNATVAAEDKSCKAEVTSVKADDRKSKRNWFFRGAAVGAGVVIAIATHGLF